MSRIPRPWPWPHVLAHRGGGSLAPENTLAAIRLGISLGFRAIECDARLSRDGVPMLIHDRQLSRTTNGAGAVADTDAAALIALDAGGWFGPQYAGEPVPTLESTIAICRAHGVWVNLEIKRLDGATARIGEVVARKMAAFYSNRLQPGGDGADRIDARTPLLSSFGAEALQAARAAAPDLPRGWIVGSIPPDWEAQLEALAAVSLHADHRLLTEEAARAVKDAGYWLFCYTVDEPQRARQLLNWGVDAICTDRIDLIGPDFA